MNTDKQLQTVYVLTLGQENKARIIINFAPPVYAKEIPNVYLYTPEELEALLQKELREAAEKAFQAGEKHGSDCAYNSIGNSSIDHPPAFIWLEENYPLPQPPKQ